MSDDLIKLEIQREQLYQRMQSIGDFRRGSISVTFCKCGKKNCACAAKDHPGHGPHYRWTTTRKGKSFAQHLPLGPELDKARKEIGAYILQRNQRQWYDSQRQIVGHRGNRLFTRSPSD